MWKKKQTIISATYSVNTVYQWHCKFKTSHRKSNFLVLSPYHIFKYSKKIKVVHYRKILHNLLWPKKHSLGTTWLVTSSSAVQYSTGGQ
jgi:hypothetical protein